MLQGLVLAGGMGQRLRPFTLSYPKHLIPLLGKPVIGYPIEHLMEVGIRDICVVIGYMGELIINDLSKRYGDKKINLRYVKQERRLGIAHAIKLSIEDGAIDAPFITYLGDNIVANGIKKYAKQFIESNSDVLILLSRVKNPSRFGVAVLEDGRVKRLIEKPKERLSDLAVIGVYFFRDPELVIKAFKTLKPSYRGEYEITDLINWFIKNGYVVAYDIITGWWKDVGTSESLLEALYLLLDSVNEPQVKGRVDGEIIGKVIVEEGAIVEGNIYGPAYIGRDAVISENAILEHYVSLETEAKVISGSITRSIILDNAEIDIDNFRMKDSIIGKYSVVKSKGIGANINIRLIISDFSRVEI